MQLRNHLFINFYAMVDNFSFLHFDRLLFFLHPQIIDKQTFIKIRAKFMYVYFFTDVTLLKKFYRSFHRLL